MGAEWSSWSTLFAASADGHSDSEAASTTFAIAASPSSWRAQMPSALSTARPPRRANSAADSGPDTESVGCIINGKPNS